MFIITGVPYKRNPVNEIEGNRPKFSLYRVFANNYVALNGVMLHHSGLIVQFLPRFQQLDKIRSFGSARISVDRLCI